MVQMMMQGLPLLTPSVSAQTKAGNVSGRSRARLMATAAAYALFGLAGFAFSGAIELPWKGRSRRVLSVVNSPAGIGYSSDASLTPSPNGTLVDESICSTEKCRAAVRWSHQSVVADGCKKLFFDVGANIGVHSRFFFEPTKYHTAEHPRHGYDDVLDEVFGADRGDSGGEGMCAVAFEPNPAHRQRHQDLAEAYAKVGWRYRAFFAAAGGQHQGHTLTFYEQDNGANSMWGFSMKHRYGGENVLKIEVPVIDLASFINFHVGSSASKPKVLMKMDIEGSEYSVLSHMFASASFRHIDALTTEFHKPACPITYSLPHGQVEYSCDDVEAFERVFPTLVKTEFQTTFSLVDDETFLLDGMPFPEADLQDQT